MAHKVYANGTEVVVKPNENPVDPYRARIDSHNVVDINVGERVMYQVHSPRGDVWVKASEIIPLDEVQVKPGDVYQGLVGVFTILAVNDGEVCYRTEYQTLDKSLEERETLKCIQAYLAMGKWKSKLD